MKAGCSKIHAVFHASASLPAHMFQRSRRSGSTREANATRLRFAIFTLHNRSRLSRQVEIHHDTPRPVSDRHAYYLGSWQNSPGYLSILELLDRLIEFAESHYCRLETKQPCVEVSSDSIQRKGNKPLLAKSRVSSISAILETRVPLIDWFRKTSREGSRSM